MQVIKTKTSEVYYDGTDICKLDAIYRVVIGLRSNGKTYYTIRRAIRKFFAKDSNGNFQYLPSVYVRRYAEDIKAVYAKKLLEPHMDFIKKVSNGEYNDYEFVTGVFRFVYRNTKGEIKKRSQDFLYTVSLNSMEHAKGSDRAPNGVAMLIFDEFLSRMGYLTDEFTLFANVISSFIRNRPGTEIWMLANTVAKYGNPYFLEMGLTDMDSMKQGQIRLYTYNNEKLKVAVEYCAVSKAVSDVEHYYAFDNPQLSILTNGDWEMESYRHWHSEYFSMDEDTFRFKTLLEFQGHSAVGEVHKSKDDLIIFWHPLGKSKYKWSTKDCIFTDKPITNRHYSDNFRSGFTKKQALVCKLMANHRDFYSDNTIGELVRAFRMWNGGK